MAPKREIFAWAMFDFANSSYTTVVTTTIFNQYFVHDICKGLSIADATFRLTLSLAIANGLVVVTAPLVGALADAIGKKKFLLFIATAICVLTTAGLAFIQPGGVIMAMVLFILSGFGFGTSEYLIAAFLPELAPKDRMGKISSLGWTLGYIGGLVILGLCLAYVSWAQKQGQASTQFVPVTLLFVAAIFAAASTPTFIWLKERAQAQALTIDASLPAALCKKAFGRIQATLKTTGRYRDLLTFLIALFCFSCGTTTVVALAAVYASEVMHFATSETIAMVMLVQVSAAAGAFGLGSLQDKIGSIPTLTMALILWVVAVAVAYFAPDKLVFWIAATLMGAAMGATGSAARALVGQLAPRGQAAEFFGLWGLTVKLSAVVGPMTYGAITRMTGGNYRTALLSTIGFFILGLLVTLRVNQERGVKQASLAVDAA